MRLAEILIIYFSFGLPLWVYYVLNNHRRLNVSSLIGKSIFVLLFWFLWAGSVLKQVMRDTRAVSVNEKKLLLLRNQIHCLLSSYCIAGMIDKPKNSVASLLKLRQVVDRYIDLTISKQESLKWGIGGELMRISSHPNPEIGSRCLRRRNHLRIKTRQNQATQDMLTLLKNTTCDMRILELILQIARELHDYETIKALDKIVQLSTARRSKQQRTANEQKIVAK
ncbi:MAG: hypothetical protein D6735_00175 [Acidobacteria bacterium]|nr:MAG: hypothetical protein D6735_00175 [Acidobacteriota bacterium]